MIDRHTLQSVEAAEIKQDRPALFACLASRYAAVRAGAAAAILRLYAPPGTRTRGGLARDFGSEPEAVIMPFFAELSGVIGWQPSPAWPRFLASLDIGFDQWHDGIGYDLEALSAMHPEERAMIGQWLRTRLTGGGHAIDWRELEAAAALNDTVLLRSLTQHHDGGVRLRVRCLLGEPGEIQAELCRALDEADDAGTISRASDLAREYPGENVKQALIARLRRHDKFFVSLAMTLLEVFAANGADGWAERPFLFRVKEEDAEGPLWRELLAKVGE